MKTIIASILTVLSLFATNVGAFHPEGKKQFEIIGNQLNNIEEVTYEELYMIFTLRQRYWSNGLEVKSIYFPFDHEQSIEFAHEFLGMTAHQFYTTVKRNADRYGIKVIVEENRDLIAKIIFENVGAIAYGHEIGNHDKVKHFKVVHGD